MAWNVKVVDSDAVAVKAYLDGLSLTTINAFTIAPLSARKVLIAIEGT